MSHNPHLDTSFCDAELAADRLGAVTGLLSDHVPIAFAATFDHQRVTHTVQAISYNLSNQVAHRWFAESNNAYARTDLVASQEALKGKVVRQLEELAKLLTDGHYDVALFQEADPISVAEIMVRSDELGVDVFSDLDNPESESHGKTWILSGIMMPKTGRYGATGTTFSGDYIDTSNDRKCRVRMPVIALHEKSNPAEEIARIACAHIAGNDLQYPATGIAYVLSAMECDLPTIVAGDFNTTTINISDFLNGRWSLTKPTYFTHMCKLDDLDAGEPPRYYLVAYDNVVHRNCAVDMLPLPTIDAAGTLLRAFDAVRQ